MDSTVTTSLFNDSGFGLEIYSKYMQYSLDKLIV